MSNEVKFKVDKYHTLELQKCPHLLIGGCTGSGKSYLMKSVVSDILCGEPDVRLFIVDPKCVDYQFLEGSKFNWDGLDSRGNREVKRCWLRRGLSLLTRDQIESGFVKRLLEWVIEQMNDRYKSMMERGLVLWDGYPIVLVIDELADLIYWDRDKERDKEPWSGGRGKIEKLLVKIATLGRAARIHLILGTQRPDASILSGQLRANIPSRICLKVSNDTERRIILGVGRKDVGDKERMLYYDGEYQELIRELR